MTTYYIGDIGQYINPLDYLYNRDIKTPSTNRCHCGKYLETLASTLYTPTMFYYNKTCIYHSKDILKICYTSNGKEYEYYYNNVTKLISEKIYKPWEDWQID